MNECRKRMTMRTERAAKDRLLKIKVVRALRGRDDRRERRVYFCRQHRGWHFTSQE